MSDDGHLIDEALRNVSLPPDWNGRLRPEVLFADPQIDRLLADVAVPADLGERIRGGFDRQPGRRQDGTIDLGRMAGTVPPAGQGVAPRLRRRFRAAVWLSVQPGALGGLVREAAAVAASLGLMVLVTMAGIEFSRRLEGGPKVARRGEAARASAAAPSELPRKFSAPAAAPAPAPALTDGGAAWPPAVASAPMPGGGASGRSPEPGANDPDPEAVAEAGGSPPSPESAVGEAAVVRAAPAWPDPPGSPGGLGLSTVEIPSAARRSVPRVRGYDLAFEMTTGEQPFVDPAAAASLVVDRPLLTLQTDGFDAVVTARPGTRIRAEQVLAAIPPAAVVAPEAGPLRLDIHEVRSRRKIQGRPTVLLEVAVSAAPLRPFREAGPLRLTLVLDQASAGEPAAWPRICRSLAALAAVMGSEDRVTVVICGPRARVAARAADAGRLAALAADLEWHPGADSSDLDAGLAVADPGERVVVVAHAVSLDAARDKARRALTEWHAALAVVGGDTLVCEPVGGIRFVVLDAAAPAPAGRQEPTFGRTGTDAVSIRRAVIGQATGLGTLAAVNCGLEVRFDPGRVAGYRIIGHRQSAVESLATAAVAPLDLHAGETARAVYEVIPRDPGRLLGLATAEAAWRSPDGVRQTLGAGPNQRSEDLGPGLPSPHGCELLLAAGLGELAAGSAHVERRPALVASLESLVEEWRARGDLSTIGGTLARGLESAGRGRRANW